MKILSILYGIIGILLIIEKRLIRNIVYFIMMIIILSIEIIQRNITYYSYILIILEIGAVSILFGIILLIIPDTLITLIKSRQSTWLITILTILLLYPFYFNLNLNRTLLIKDIKEIEEIKIINYLGKELYTHPYFLLNLLVLSIILIIPIVGIFTLMRSIYKLEGK